MKDSITHLGRHHLPHPTVQPNPLSLCALGRLGLGGEQPRHSHLWLSSLCLSSSLMTLKAGNWSRTTASIRTYMCTYAHVLHMHMRMYVTRITFKDTHINSKCIGSQQSFHFLFNFWRFNHLYRTHINTHTSHKHYMHTYIHTCITDVLHKIHMYTHTSHVSIQTFLILVFLNRLFLTFFSGGVTKPSQFITQHEHTQQLTPMVE